MCNKKPIAVATNSNAAGQNLRRRAEDKIKGNIANAPKLLADLSVETAALILNDLRVHQFELEMQNKELQRTKEKLEAICSRYFDIYNSAPVGHLSLSETGLILEANSTAATQLGVDRDALIHQLFIRFVLPEDQESYDLHLKQLVKTGAAKSIELRMLRQDGRQFWVRIEEALTSNENDETLCHAVLIDISEHKLAQEDLPASPAG